MEIGGKNVRLALWRSRNDCEVLGRRGGTVAENDNEPSVRAYCMGGGAGGTGMGEWSRELAERTRGAGSGTKCSAGDSAEVFADAPPWRKEYATTQLHLHSGILPKGCFFLL